MKRGMENDNNNNNNGTKKLKKPSVAFKGMRNNFTEAAAIQHFEMTEKVEVETSPCNSFQEVFEHVKMNKASYGIVPIENSASGTLHSVYDELLNSELFIIGECSRLEEHMLCALPGTKLKNVTQILSHPAMFMQCSEFIKTLDNNASSNSDSSNTTSTTTTSRRRVGRESFWDTSAACSHLVSENLTNAAVICSKESAIKYKLDILEEGVGNDKNNETRYLLISKDEYTLPELNFDSRTRMKCSVAVALRNETNALFKMVSCFGLRSINIIKMESRPATTASTTQFILNSPTSKNNINHSTPQKKFTVKHWDYLFYVDFEPSWDLTKHANLMASLKEFSLGVRNFGVYKQNLPDVLVVKSPWHGVGMLSTF